MNYEYNKNTFVKINLHDPTCPVVVIRKDLILTMLESIGDNGKPRVSIRLEGFQKNYYCFAPLKQMLEEMEEFTL